MNVNRCIIAGFCALASAGLTAGLVWVDSQRAEKALVETHLRWARQVATQAEALTLNARQHMERDALGAAVHSLNLGEEPRAMRISKFEGRPGKNTERFVWNTREDAFDYSRVLFAENGQGVRVRIEVGYVGFLGAHTRASNDLSVVLVFLGIFYGLYSVLRMFLSKKAKPVSVSPVIEPLQPAALVEARQTLITLGTHLRETIRAAQSLASAAGRSHTAFEGMSDGVRSGLQAIAQVGRQVSQAEATAVNLAIEASKFGSEGKNLKAAAEDLHQTLRGLRLPELEARLTALWAGAEDARHGCDGVSHTAQEMDQHITQTTQAIRTQAQLIRRIHGTKAS